MRVYATGVLKFLHILVGWRFMRFIVIGVVNSVFGYSLFAFFLILRLRPEVALLMATIIGLIFNIYTTRRIVFQDQKQSKIFAFLAVYFFVYITNAVALRFLTYMSLSPLVSQFALLPVAAILTYILLQKIVYRKHQ